MAGFGEMQQGRNSQEEDYLSRNFRVAFDSTDTVEFIELSAGGTVAAVYKGSNLFELAAAEAVKWIGQDATPAPETEGGHTYTFPDLELSLWRSQVSSARRREGWSFQTVALAKWGYFNGA